MTSPAGPVSCYRKRTKTFTGCWTCRGRKLKCSEERPTCRQCANKGLECGGYGARLQWLAPETGVPVPNASPALVRATGFSRRQILAAPTTFVLGSREIDRILFDIDADQPCADDEAETTIVRGPFAVFAACSSYAAFPKSPATVAPCRSIEQDLSIEKAEHIDPSLLDDQSFPPFQSHNLSQDWLLGHGNQNTTLQNITDSPYDARTASQSPASQLKFQFQCKSPYSISSSLQQTLNWSPTKDTAFHEDSETETTASLLLSKPRSTFLSHEDCFLLHHYIHKVVRIFCVVDNPKSPWRSLHLPRALQSCGELGALGATSNTRNCLLHAILSISAYSLANNLRLEGHTADVDKWQRKALQLRYKAIGLLRDSVEYDLHAKTRPKYKELLATMLSMITIDVASGDTGTCGVHLKGCEQLIRSARKNKKKYSAKARALHRIFFYLRTIHASTTLDKDTPCQSPSQEYIGSEQAVVEQDDFLRDLAIDDDSWLDMRESDPKDMTSCDHIYGVPQSLLVLMRKAVRVVQLVLRFRRSNPGLLYSTSLANKCDEVDEEILDWPIDQELSHCPTMTRGAETAKIVEHQTRAFHDALVLYFSQHVRLMHHRHLKPYVERVVYHLEEIERIKDGSNVFAGALFWPAFIAASEAFDPTLQARFMAWFERAKIYGLHSLWGGNALALEVWNKDGTNKARVTSQWRAIAEERQVELMLT